MDNMELFHDPLHLAILFHHTYERLAGGHGYEIRKETQIFQHDSPNGKLMVATCAEIQKVLKADLLNAIKENLQIS